MKTQNINARFLSVITALLILATVFNACKKTDEGAGGQPLISKVRLISKSDTIAGVVHRVTLDSNSVYDETRQVPFDSTVAAGRLNNQYAIIGENLLTTSAITFNGVRVNYNPTLLTDKSIIVTIPNTIPYGAGQTNKLIVTTKFGTASFDFPILQPAATITGFSPVAGGAGDIVTITGTVFDGVTAVRFDSIPATIVGTPTKTQIQVRVPAGIVQASIYVTTPGGTSRAPASFGFKRLIFDDLFAAGWSITSYNASTSIAATNVKRGTAALTNNYTGGYGAFRIDYNGAEINVAQLGLTAIKLSIYGGPGSTGKQVSMALNDDYADSKRAMLILKEGVYTDYTIPLSQLGNPTSIKQIVLQEFSGFAPSTIVIDDIGCI